MNAPYEYRLNYEQMPLKYKKPRVEYRLDNEGKGGGDMLVREFFGSLEYTYSAEEVLARVIKYLTQGVEDTAKAQPTEKYCLACGTKNPAKNKFCLECGGHDFAESKEAYEKSKLDKEKQARKKAEEEKQALLEELNRLKEAQRLAEEEAKKRAAKEKEEAAKSAQKALEEEEKRKAAEEERRLKEIEKAEKEAEEKARKEKEAEEKAKREAEEKAEAAKKMAVTDGEKLLQEAKAYNQKKDYQNAFPLFEQLANQKNPEAIAYTAQYYLNGFFVAKNYGKALQLAKDAAALGSPFGMNLVGYIHDLALGVPKDQKTAVEWYQKAASLGYAAAQSNLGNCYYNGWGVGIDYAKSFEWLSKSAAQGNVLGTLHLGRAYENGRGVAKSYEKAEECYRRADALDSTTAVTKLKDLSLRLTREGYPIKPLTGVQKPFSFETDAKQLVGKGRDFWTKKDYCSAFEYFKKAAATGDKEGQYELAQCYHTGHGVPLGAEEIGKCNAKATDYARMSAEQNYAPAQYLYGQMYAKQGAHTNALSYFEKAALQGYAPAYARVANYYKEGNDWGWGIRKNVNKAFEWYQKAAQHDPKYQKEVDELQKILDERKAAKQKKAEESASSASSAPKKEAAKPISNPPASELNTKKPETKPAQIPEQKPAVKFPEVTAEQIEKAKQAQPFYDAGLKHLKEGKPNDAMKAFALGSLFGHAGCVHEWGKAFMQGIGPHAIDHKKGFEKFFEAAHLPNPPKEVYADVAACYLHGIGVEKDLQKSLEWYERAAVVEEKYKEHVKIVRSKLSSQSTKNTVTVSTKPAPVKPAPVKSTPISAPTKTPVKAPVSAPVKAPVSAPVKTPAAPSVPPMSAPTTTQKTAAQKQADGEKYYKQAKSTTDAARKIELLQLAVDNDHSGAMFELGLNYQGGHKGLVANPQKAFDLFIKASKVPNHLCGVEHALGSCYKLGIGVSKDEKKAFKYFLICANDTSLDKKKGGGIVDPNVFVDEFDAKVRRDKARIQVGKYYENGLAGVVLKNDEKALEWYEKAAEGVFDTDYSKMKVAEFYLAGKGGKKRKKEAIAIYKEIARNSKDEKLKKEAAAILDKLLLFGWRG